MDNLVYKQNTQSIVMEKRMNRKKICEVMNYLMQNNIISEGEALRIISEVDRLK